MKDASAMFVKGSKKMTLLKEVVHLQNAIIQTERKSIFASQGGWKTRKVINLMLLALPYIIETLEGYSKSFPSQQVSYMGTMGPLTVVLGQTRCPSAMRSFEFVVVLTIIVKVLDFLKGPTKKIPERALDLLLDRCN